MDAQWVLNGSSTQRHYNLIAKISQYLASSIRLLEIDCKYTPIFSYFQIFPLRFVNKMPFLRCFPAILCRFHAKMPIFFRFLSIFLHISFFLVTLQPKVAKTRYEQVRNSFFDECDTVVCTKVCYDAASRFPLFAEVQSACFLNGVLRRGAPTING